MKTASIRKHEPRWHLIDAQDQVLGRLATRTADLLRGKLKPEFVPYLDCGDHVVVVNAAKVVLTGNKLADKTYYHHSWFLGGLKSIRAKDLLETRPDRVITHAVKGMLPKNKLQAEWLKRLHVYPGAEHPHQANVSAPTTTTK